MSSIKVSNQIFLTEREDYTEVILALEGKSFKIFC